MRKGIPGFHAVNDQLVLHSVENLLKASNRSGILDEISNMILAESVKRENNLCEIVNIIHKSHLPCMP